jgi:hypothetical protein
MRGWGTSHPDFLFFSFFPLALERAMPRQSKVMIGGDIETLLLSGKKRYGALFLAASDSSGSIDIQRNDTDAQWNAGRGILIQYDNARFLTQHRHFCCIELHAMNE